jgi:ribonuclease P protein component
VLPQPHRLRHTADHARVRQQGRRWKHPLVTLIICANPLAEKDEVAHGDSPIDAIPSRFSVIAGRAVGSAVRRNRVKRRLREIIRQRLDGLTPGWDCLLIARPQAADVSFAELEGAVIQLLKRSGVLVNQQAGKQQRA